MSRGHIDCVLRVAVQGRPSVGIGVALGVDMDSGFLCVGISLVGPPLNLDNFYATQDELHDLAWSAKHENQVVSLILLDVMLNSTSPTSTWSSSYQPAWKLSQNSTTDSLTTLHANSASIYQAPFSPHRLDLIDAVYTNGVGVSVGGPAGGAGGVEVLRIDWIKYRPFVLASMCIERLIREWDHQMVEAGVGQPTESSSAAGGQIHYPPTPTVQVFGCEYAARKVQCSPHHADVLASASSDMTCRVWSMSSFSTPQQNPLLAIHDTHTEFIVGCACSRYEVGVPASCSVRCVQDRDYGWMTVKCG
ncbi:hypothetical protein BD410DRAFT_809067 [Rickenella mellea]|uniref:WD40 repeat-like protein n=1 Tax=Rickenella mellea TaxID=50990 RepID=A0A4Y7PIP4_9AGAM|nr:hypothetical protein BD410DRAFT_809067 [Rickenella mellea]